MIVGNNRLIVFDDGVVGDVFMGGDCIELLSERYRREYG